MLIPLTGGAYEARSLIADVQRCINLYPEQNAKDAAAPFTHYPTAGLTTTGFVGGKPCRWIYQASNGNMYTVFGDNTGSVLYVSTPSTTDQGIVLTTMIGTFGSLGTTPVSMADNGIVLIIVDGTTTGYALDLSNSANFGPITDPNFLGASRVDYLDTFFIFNVPNTNEWFISLSESNYSMFTGVPGSILTGSILSPGTGSYNNGTYTAQNFTGGSGTGAIGNFTVAGNVVTAVTVTSAGTSYQIGDVLSVTLPGTSISTGIIAAPGTGYTNGSYPGQTITGGSGTGATADITVAAGAVTVFTINNPGIGYSAGDSVSALIPGGTGLAYTVNTVQGAGFSYSVDTITGQAFDPLDIAAKTGYPDPIVTIIVMDLYIWLIGTQTTELWFNAGAADFAFQIFPGVFIEHGCAAQYSIAKQDLSVYWLSQDKQGRNIVIQGNNFAAHRISTFAIENEFAKYSTVADAIGFIYQQYGHVFYVLTFPTADKTWVFDQTTELWHEENSLQLIQNGAFTIDGNLHKVIYNSCAYAGGKVYVGDGIGNIWQLDPNNYTENGVPIPRIRSFPHLINDQKRVSYSKFIADMETGTDDYSLTNDGSSSANPPTVSLRWSDDRGRTYGNYVQQSMGALGQYLTSIQWNRLGYARDRVFELSWSVPTKTALNGAWIEGNPSGS